MIFWLWCVYFFTANMNLLVFMTTLLLGNTTTNIDLTARQPDLQSRSGFLEQHRQQLSEEFRFHEQWQQYKSKYDKYYEDFEEEYKRKKIFIQNSMLIEEHNLLYNKGLSSYELGHNDFSDMTHEEFLGQYTTFENSSPDFEENAEPTVRNNPTVQHESTVRYDYEPTVRSDFSAENRQNSLDNDYLDYMPPAYALLPLWVDWRTAGAVTPVKHQGRCNASWLFSATGTLEGQVFRKTRNLTTLSEQNILDCSNKYGNDGCHNGSVYNSLKYVQLNKGIDTNVTYPWYGKKSWFCHYKHHPSNPKVRDIVKILSHNESALQAAVATVGPISVGIDASSRQFQFYRGGIYNDLRCSRYKLNHDLLVVGYARNYWIVKNSLGKSWGAKGYIYMSKGRGNQCGIATRALYPLI